ncbi:MAG: thioesterase family protein [Streptosporangiaceae bacterium]
MDVSRGRGVMAQITTPGVGSRAARWSPATPIPAPLRLHEAAVGADRVDYNHHLTEWAYLLICGDNSDAFFRFFGVDEVYRGSGRSLYTAETHLHHLREVTLGQRLSVTLQVLGMDAKRLHIAHEIFDDAGELAAAAEQMLLHVDTRARAVTPFPEEIAGRLRQIRAAHAALPVPGYIGHVMRIPGR